MWVLAAACRLRDPAVLTLQRPFAKYSILIAALVVVVLMIGGPLKLDPKFWGVVLMVFRC